MNCQLNKVDGGCWWYGWLPQAGAVRPAVGSDGNQQPTAASDGSRLQRGRHRNRRSAMARRIGLQGGGRGYDLEPFHQGRG